MSGPSWKSASSDWGQDYVEALETFKTSANAAIEVVQTIISIAKAIADFIVAIYVDLANLEAEALRAAIQALRAIIEDLTTSAGAYALLVPMKIVDPLQWTGDPQSFYLGERVTKLSTPFLQTVPGPDAINQPSGGTGGNYGFYATVAESLKDYNDPGRPELDDDAYIAGVVMLFGSDTYLELVVLLKKLMRLFDLPGVDLAPGAVPTPKNLRATIIPTPVSKNTWSAEYWVGDSDLVARPHSVKLEWDRDPKDWAAAAYGPGIQAEIDKVILYRWVEGEMTESQVRAGATSDNLVTLETEYDEMVPLFIDNTIEPGNVYHYGVSYTYNIVDEDGNTLVAVAAPDVDIVSIRVDLPDNIKVGPGRGDPPDWFAFQITPSIPPLHKVFRFVLDWLDRMEASIHTGKDDLEEFVNFLDREINRYVRWVQEIANEIQELIDALTLPDVYVGILPFAGEGGTQYFLDMLGKKLFDENDTERPPFDKGTEAVAGLVLLTGSETPGKALKFFDTLKLLLGSTVTSVTNTYNEAAESIGALEEELDRQICLTQALIQKECEESEEYTTVDSGLNPSNESAECEAEAQVLFDSLLEGDS